MIFKDDIQTDKKEIKMALVKTRTTRLGFKIYNENPFLGDMVIQSKKRTLTVARGTKLVSIDGENDQFQSTIAQVKEVDEAQFVKIFTSQISLMLDLNRAGNKVFFVLLHEVQQGQIGTDRVFISWPRIEKKLQQMDTINFSYKTFLRGMKDMLAHKVLANTDEEAWFFINPNLLFNGDRVTFITQYKKTKVGKSPDQKCLFEADEVF